MMMNIYERFYYEGWEPLRERSASAEAVDLDELEVGNLCRSWILCCSVVTKTSGQILLGLDCSLDSEAG